MAGYEQDFAPHSFPAHRDKESACCNKGESTLGETSTKNGCVQRLSYNGSERSLCNGYLCFSPLAHLLKGEHAMKDEELFSNDGLPSTTSAHERGGNSD